MKISDIFKEYDAEIIGNDDLDIKDICYDSRKCIKDSMFFAIEGEKNDGHNFIKNAIENGAIAVVCKRDFLIKNIDSVTFIKVKDTKDALSYASERFFNSVSERLRIIGVTGTNGKTTITYLLERIFENCGIIGTINYRCKGNVISAINTTPISYELCKLMNEFRKKEVDTVIMEVSSHGVELKRINYINFDCGIFTNLTHEHLDFHKSMENYYNSKKKFFTEILAKSKKENKFAIINIDDEYGKRLYKELEGVLQTYSYSLKDRKADAYPVRSKISLKGIEAKVKVGNKEINIKSNLIGEFNLYNILASVLCAYLFGVPENVIEKRLNKKIVIPGRMERVIENKNYFVDYAHTPDALENVLLTLSKIKGKRRLITVFGCGGDRDKEKRPLMGYIASKYSDFIVVTSDNPRTEDPFMIIDDIMKGVDRAIKEGLINENNFRVIPDRRDAIVLALKASKNNDIVLVAGKGHEDYQIIGDKKFKFSDKEVILENV